MQRRPERGGSQRATEQEQMITTELTEMGNRAAAISLKQQQ